MTRTRHTNIGKPSAGAGKSNTSNMNTQRLGPQSNLPKSGPMQTHLLPKKTTRITRYYSQKKRLPSSSPYSSLASESSNVEATTSATSEDVNKSTFKAASKTASKVAAFHEARGLDFNELYVEPDQHSTAAASQNIPQKSSTTETPASTSTAVETATSPAIKRDISIQTKQTATKRAAPSDSDITPSPTKRIKLLPPRPPGSAAESTVKNFKLKGLCQVTQAPVVPNDGQVITKNGKVKKTPQPAVEQAFIGTPSNHGHSLERPQAGTLATPWNCANLNCSTGMTWSPRDTTDQATGQGPMGRKVLSQFFGRNKAPTKLIDQEVWHYKCRKCYQRTRYSAEKGASGELPNQVIENLRDQLIRLKLWRPNALFKVQLIKGANDRLNSYFGLLRQHNNNEAAALAALPGPKDPSKVKPEEVFPPALSEVFNQRFRTTGRVATATYDDIEDIIAWSETEINAGNSTVLVPAEFLINEPQAGETINNTSHNFDQWEVIYNARLAAQAAANAAAANTAQAAVNTTPATAFTTAYTLPQPHDVVQSIEDTEATESPSEPSTPTPAPRSRRIKAEPSSPPAPATTNKRIQEDPDEPMSLLRILNDVVETIGYHAQVDHSA
jgi:hypothetical protein